MAIKQRPEKPKPDLTGTTSTGRPVLQQKLIEGGVTGPTAAPGTGEASKKSTRWIAKTSPLTQEVQNREEQRAAYEALVGAAESDLARRESIMQEAETAGRRQAAEAMLQGTRGMEAGGARAAMGRQAAADTLMQQQQMAATRAAETPAFDIAQLKADVTAQIQALGDLGTDRIAKMASYQQLLEPYAPGEARDAALESLITEAIRQGDYWVVTQLNNQFSTGPKDEYAYALDEQGNVAEFGGENFPGWTRVDNPDGSFYYVKYGAESKYGGTGTATTQLNQYPEVGS